MPCIYGIINEITGKVYIGKTTDSQTRFKKHRSSLKCNKHHNSHLQNSYNKHGKDNFKYTVLEECALDDLSAKEQHWIDQNKGNLFNKDLNVGEYGLNGFYQKKHKDEVKRLMSLKKKGIYDGPNNPNFGKKASKETKMKMVKNNSNTKLTEKKVLKIVKFLKDGVVHQEIADMFQVGRTVVTRISNGTRWSNVTGGPVIPVVYKDGIRQFNESHRQRVGRKKGHKHTEETKQLMRDKALNRTKGD